MKMIKLRWFTRPLFIFIVSLVALGSSLAIYITTYVEINNAFVNFVEQHNMDPDQLQETTAWANILILSILVALIITCTIIAYFYFRKVSQLYKMQHNFINGFTHELKTPVTSLKLFLDTLSRYELPRNEQLKYINYMKRDVDRLSNNTSQILNLARIGEKEYRADFVEVNLPLFIKNLIKKNGHIFNNVDITMTGESSLLVLADKYLLEVLTMNILNNAVTHNTSRKVKIIIRARNLGAKAGISFQDNGIGIEKKHRKKIFKKFYRIRTAVKGSGIGLYVAHQIAKLHGGNMYVDTPESGRGSIFHAVLPKENYVA